MKKQHRQKLTVRVTPQTAYNLERLMTMSGQKTPGRVVDKLVREKMLPYGATPEKWRETDERRNFAYDRLLGDLHGAKTLHAETGRGYKGEYIRLEPRGPGGEAGRTAQAWPADCGEVGLARGGLGGNRPCGSSGRVAFLPDRRGANGNPCRVRLSGIGGAL